MPCATTATTDEVRIATQNGDRISGTAVFSADGLQVNGQFYEFETLTRVDVLSDQPANPPVVSSADGNVQIHLIDGSRITAGQWSLQNQICQIGSNTRIQTRDIRAIQLRVYVDSAMKKQWNKVSSTPPEAGDALVIQRNGRLDTLEGVVGNVIDGRLTFAMDEREANISLNKIEGVVFYHAAGRELVEPFTHIEFRNGSHVVARKIESVDEGTLTIETVAGVRLDARFDELLSMDFELGRVVQLSELKPSSVDWQSLLTSAALLPNLKRLNAPRINRSFQNGPLTLTFYPDPNAPYLSQRREFQTGFAIKAGSKMAFALGASYSKLSGFVGFDPSASPSGNVLLRFRADGKILLEQQLENVQFVQPLEINLNVQDVERLVIELDYCDGRDVGDILHLCDLKVIK